MPSLLSRFLGKKKNADPTLLLDGEKYEAVPKTPSPSAPTFPESAQRPKSPSTAKSKEQPERSIGIPIRRKQASSGIPNEPKVKEPPILSLNLPNPKLEEKRLQGLGVVFEGITDGPLRLDDEVLGARRLTATETLTLVQKTAEVLCERALETLGVMRPHWFASPRQQEAQLQLINRFLQTLPGSQNSGMATGSKSSPATFESELRYTRDPHDVAAVLRWGLRHLQLDRNYFGSSTSVDWYRSFAESERSGSYPSKAFDDILVPLLPVSHTQLLRATLDLVSSLAAHSEENGISGNKLSKVLGWWIVSSRNVQSLGWREFYAQWEAAARQFEHIFLAYIRAQQVQSRMPKRLTEIVKNYPYTKNRREEDGIFLPRSRFSTRSATALFVRVTVDKSNASSRPHPLRIVEDAFKAEAENDSTGDYVTLWQNLRTIASKPSPSGDDSMDTSERAGAEASLSLSSILADETIRLLSLVPAPDGPSGPTHSLFTPLPTGRSRASYSAGDRSPTTPAANGSTQGHIKDASSNGKATGSPSVSTRELDVATDWQAFSNAGFQSPSGLSLAASLWDTDTEVSQPTPKKSTSGGKRNLSIRPPSRSASAEAPLVLPSSHPGRLTYGAPQIVKLDEAFIDFWADTLLDSIARSWPTFVVCQLKAIPTLRLPESGKLIEWLVIERVLVEPSHSLSPQVKTSAASARAASPTPASPTKSESSKSRWTATTVAATRKRWSLFSHKHESAPVVQRGRDQAVRVAAKTANVGEMGEILKEVDEAQPHGPTVNGKSGVNGVKEAERQNAMPLQPATHLEGVSKPESSAIANLKDGTVTEAAMLATADSASPQDSLGIANQPNQAVYPTVQSTVVETISELQRVAEPAPKEGPVAVSVLPQEHVAIVAEPVFALQEPRTPIAIGALAEPLTSSKDDLASHPPDENSVMPEPQTLEEEISDAPKVKEGPEASITPAAEQGKPAWSVLAISQEDSVEDPSLVEDYDVFTPLEGGQGSVEHVTLEDATVDLLSTVVPEVALPCKASPAENPVSEPQHTSNGTHVASVEGPPAELNAEKPELAPAAAPEEATITIRPDTKDIVTADSEPDTEVVVPTTVAVKHAEEGSIPLRHPDVPGEHEGSEDIPIDEDWLANAEPAVSEPNSTDDPAVIDPETTDDVATKEDAAEGLPS